MKSIMKEAKKEFKELQKGSVKNLKKIRKELNGDVELPEVGFEGFDKLVKGFLDHEIKKVKNLRMETIDIEDIAFLLSVNTITLPEVLENAVEVIELTTPKSNGKKYKIVSRGCPVIGENANCNHVRLFSDRDEAEIEAQRIKQSCIVKDVWVEEIEDK